MRGPPLFQVTGRRGDGETRRKPAKRGRIARPLSVSPRLGVNPESRASLPTIAKTGNLFPHSFLRSLAVTQHFGRGVFSTSAHHAAARVGRASAQIQPVNRRAVVAPAGHGAQAEELMQRHAPLKDVTAGQTECAFQIDGRKNVPMQDRKRLTF